MAIKRGLRHADCCSQLGRRNACVRRLFKHAGQRFEDLLFPVNRC